MGKTLIRVSATWEVNKILKVTQSLGSVKKRFPFRKPTQISKYCEWFVHDRRKEGNYSQELMS